jgi:hypothetical protein
MATMQRELANEVSTREMSNERCYEAWVHWPVNWTPIWVGALAASALNIALSI